MQCLSKRQQQLHPRKKMQLSIWSRQLPPIIRYPKMWYFRINNPTRTRVQLIGKRGKNFDVHFKKLSKPCNKKNLQRIYLKLVYKLLLKPTSHKILVQIPKMKLLRNYRKSRCYSIHQTYWFYWIYQCYQNYRIFFNFGRNHPPIIGE